MTLRVSVIRKNKSKGVKTWYARIADPEQGIEVYRSLGTTLKGEAQFLAAKALEDFRHKEIDITLERAFAEVVKDRELRGYDSKTVDEAEFKERIGDTGYYDLPQGERTWTHIPATRQIIMAKTLHGNDGRLHTFRIAIDT